MEDLENNNIRVIGIKKINANTFYKIFGIILIILGILTLFVSIVSKLNRIETNTRQTMSIVEVNDSLARYNHLLNEENDILYKYIENIDTFKNIDDAYQASEDLFDIIQELYE